MNKEHKDLNIANVKIDDNFWNKRLRTNREITIDHQYKQLRKSGCLDNFLKASGKKEGKFQGMWFSDSDAYKWLETASYVLKRHPNPELKEKMDKVIAIIASAQENNGYLNTYFSLKEPDKKWTNLGMMHELYCAGHLFQSAVAHRQATGQDSLFAIACKFADHIAGIFGEGKRMGYPGHEEVEIGLIDLYQESGNDEYLALAEFFVENRGREHSPFKEELRNLDSIGGSERGKNLYRKLFEDDQGNYDGRYAQDHKPLKDQTKVSGHAVRATYLYIAATKIAIASGNDKFTSSLYNLWNNMTKKRMYITGGIGSSHQNEGFTTDYDLPNEEAYAETCAAVGNIMWNHEMLTLTGHGKFADLIERTLYNGFLSGVGLDGRHFFYVNPLASDGHHHRQSWFPCACCPPNAARLLASLERYIYTVGEGEIYINLFIAGSAEITISGHSVTLEQKTDYPWKGEIEIRVLLEEPMEFVLNLRIPGWCQEYELSLNGARIEVESLMDRGYAQIKRFWGSEDIINLKLEISVEQIIAHPKVKADEGRVALKRGPIVYCVEEVDNSVSVDKIFVPEKAVFQATYEPDLLDGITTLEGEALTPVNGFWDNTLYRRRSDISFRQTKIKAIPYYAWDNRDPGAMRVWVKGA